MGGTTRETDQEEEECLQDADLLHPETGIEEMRELGDVEDETMTLHQDVMIEDKEEETSVAVTLVIETAAHHPGTMIAEMMIVLDPVDSHTHTHTHTQAHTTDHTPHT